MLPPSDWNVLLLHSSRNGAIVAISYGVTNGARIGVFCSPPMAVHEVHRRDAHRILRL